METVSKIIPIFVFLSVYNLIQADFSSSISGVLRAMIISAAGTTLSIMIYMLIISFYFKVSPKRLMLKLLPTWLIAFSTASSSAAMVVVISFVSMATPPIPGGCVTSFSVLFSQLGIPLEAVAIAVAIDSLLDFVMTSSNLTCPQTELILTSDKLNLLDRGTLKS